MEEKAKGLALLKLLNLVDELQQSQHELGVLMAGVKHGFYCVV